MVLTAEVFDDGLGHRLEGGPERGEDAEEQARPATPTTITAASGWMASVWPSLPMVKLCQRRNAAAEADAHHAAGEAEHAALAEDEPADGPAGKSERAQHGVFLHPAAHDEQQRVGDEAGDRDDRADTQPAGEADQFDRARRRFRRKRLFPGGCRWVPGRCGRVRRWRWPRVRAAWNSCDPHVELGDHSETGARGLLEEGQFHIGHVVVLRERASG